MKVSFVVPKYHNNWEALSIGYIASYCKKHYKKKLEFEFYQGIFDPHYEIINGCLDSDIVAFSCTSPTFQEAVDLAYNIKLLGSRAKVVIGGWHTTALRDLVFSNDVLKIIIDQIVIGEGETAFLEILNGSDNEVVFGEKLNFDELPWPDRKLIKNNRTLDLCEQMTGLRIASFQAHRGCPFNCKFCSESCMSGKYHKLNNPIRSRDISDLLKEIMYVKESYHINYFKFVDATFDVDPSYVIDFCVKKISLGLDLPWECMIHASLATYEMFYWLERANCKQVNIGVESGSNERLKEIGKGLTTEIIEKVFSWSRQFNIETRGFFILGMPNDTEEDLQKMQELIDKIKPDVVGFTILCPYPGSDFYDHKKFEKIKWAETDEYSNDFWFTKNFTNQQLKEWQKRLTEKYKDKLCLRQK